MSVIESQSEFVKKILPAHPVGLPSDFTPRRLAPADSPSVEARIVFVSRNRKNGIREVIFNRPVGIAEFLKESHRRHRKVFGLERICDQVCDNIPRVDIKYNSDGVVHTHPERNVSACNVPSSDAWLLVYASGSHFADRRLAFLGHSYNHVAVKDALCFRWRERFCFFAGILLFHVLFGTHSLKIEYRNRVFRCVVPLLISSRPCVPRNKESFPPVVGSRAVEFLKERTHLAFI